MTRPSNVIKTLKPGQVLTAEIISDLQKAVNGLSGGVQSPANKGAWFGEVARTVKTISVDITSDDPGLTIDPIEFDQMQTCTLKNAQGDVIVLVFNNPDST